MAGGKGCPAAEGPGGKARAPRKGSSRAVREERLAGFAHEVPGDASRPGLPLLTVLCGVSGADGSCPGASDEQALGILGQWAGSEAWVASRKLAVLRELASRYPAQRDTDTDPDGAGGLDDEVSDDLAREVSLQLGMSIPGARKLILFAVALGDRVPGIGVALGEGRLDPGRARMICEETGVLNDPGHLTRAEEMILAGMARCRTYAELQRLAQLAVCTVDPDGARKRRELEEKENARVRFWREAAGTCALLGTGLPTDEALAAYEHVEARARDYRAAGVKRRIEILRIAAYLDLLNGVLVAERVARFRAQDAAEDTAEAVAPPFGQATDDPPGDGGIQGAGEPVGEDAVVPAGVGAGGEGVAASAGVGAGGEGVAASAGVRAGGEDVAAPVDVQEGGDGDPGKPPRGGGSATEPAASFSGRVNLTLAEMDIPLLTVLGFGAAARPGPQPRCP
jgi:hypothetical protein